MTVFPVEYTTLSSKALLDTVIEAYAFPEATSICFIKRGFNDTYLISTDKTDFILRVYKYNYRSSESIETEIKLLLHLHKNNVSVSYPIADSKNHYIQTINAPEGKRYAVLFTYAKGEVIRKLSIEQSFLLGIDCAKIHKLTCNLSLGTCAQDYELNSQFSKTLTVLKPILHKFPEELNILTKLQDDFLRIFNSPDTSTLSKGICHGDLQAENFHITSSDQFTFFDFDFFGKGYLAYDIGVFRWYDHKNKTTEIMNSFLRGYRTIKELNAIEIALIPYFGVLRALFQMTLICEQHNGSRLPLWKPQQVAEFIRKTNQWYINNCKPII